VSAMRGVRVCATPAQLMDLAESWDCLDTFLDAPFGKHAWVMSCAEQLAADVPLFAPVILDGKTPVAVAPLARPQGLLGAARHVEDHGEPGDFNFRDTECLDRLAAGLAASRVPLALERTPADSPAVEALRRAYRRRGFVIVRPRPGCPFIEIDGTPDETSARLSASLRSDLRRASRKAEQIGVVSFETHAPATERDLLLLWEEAVKVEAAGWKGRSGTALDADRRIGSFYRSYATRACERGILRILFLRLGADVAAMMIAVEASDRWWILKIGYDERFADCSPGMLLLHEALRDAARRGLRSYEFLGSPAGWTRRWTERERPMARVLVYPWTVQGVAVLAHDTVMHARHKMSQRHKG
jgi:hypothetical protein